MLNKQFLSNFSFLQFGTILLISILTSSILITRVLAATPVISNERVQLRTLANGDVVVNVSAGVQDLDGIAGLRVTVERAGAFGPFPLQPGLCSTANDSATQDTFTVTMGTEFIPEDQRAGNYTITVNDGGGPISTTVTLPEGLVPLPPGGQIFFEESEDSENKITVDTGTGLLTPTVSMPAIDTLFYRLSIVNDSPSPCESQTFDGVSGGDLSSTPSIQVGPGILQAGNFYRLSIDAFDAIRVGRSNRRSESADICYDPATGNTNIPCITQKDVHLITEADGRVVMQAIGRVLDRDDLAFLKNPPRTDPPTMPVTVSRGAFGPFQLTASPLVDVDIDSDVTDRFASSRNPLDASEIPEDQRAGDYIFRAEDGTGNVVSVSRNFPAGLDSFPIAGPLSIDPSPDPLEPTVSIPPVPGATNYRVVIFNDTDSTRKNFDDLPGGTLSEFPSVKLFPGILEPNKSYRIHMDAFNAARFSTSTVRSRSNSQVYDPSGLDTDGDGIQNTIDGQFAGGFVDESAGASNNFTNQHRGGTVFGSIIDRADLNVVVVVPSDPNTGVRLGAAGGSGTARVNACLPTVDINLTDRDAVEVNCGSLMIKILDGPVEFLLGSNGTLIAPAGAILTIDEIAPGQYSVQNSTDSFVPITLLVQGNSITLPPSSQNNQSPACNIAVANPSVLWPPNHKQVPVSIAGVGDSNNDPLQIFVTGVTQDEPINGLGDGATSPDAVLRGDMALLRAERAGNGNGRVYRINFTANDGKGGVCTGSVNVTVPKSKKPGNAAVDDGQVYDSTQPS